MLDWRPGRMRTAHCGGSGNGGCRDEDPRARAKWHLGRTSHPQAIVHVNRRARILGVLLLGLDEFGLLLTLRAAQERSVSSARRWSAAHASLSVLRECAGKCRARDGARTCSDQIWLSAISLYPGAFQFIAPARAGQPAVGGARLVLWASALLRERRTQQNLPGWYARAACAARAAGAVGALGACALAQGSL